MLLAAKSGLAGWSSTTPTRNYFIAGRYELARTDRKGTPIPSEAFDERVAFLPPMSGLASTEAMLQPGTVNVLLGQGRTAEVLRNLCFDVFLHDRALWDEILVPRIEQTFGATMLNPQYNPERGEITLHYKDAYMPNLELDLSSSGRGFQQTLLLTVYMLLHPNSIIMLDEPDAHLEILRQRQIYQVITETAAQQNSQLLIATHSEVVLNEAGERTFGDSVRRPAAPDRWARQPSGKSAITNRLRTLLASRTHGLGTVLGRLYRFIHTASIRPSAPAPSHPCSGTSFRPLCRQSTDAGAPALLGFCVRLVRS